MTLKFPFWCADKLELSNGEVLEFPLAKAKYDYNFLNSSGLGFEAQHVRECLLKAQYIYKDNKLLVTRLGLWHLCVPQLS